MKEEWRKKNMVEKKEKPRMDNHHLKKKVTIKSGDYNQT